MKTKQQQYEPREEPMKLDAFMHGSDSEEEDKDKWNKPTIDDIKRPVVQRDNSGLGSKHMTYEDKTANKNLNAFLYDANSNKKQDEDDDWPTDKPSSKNNLDNLYNNPSRNDTDSTNITGSRPTTSQM